MCVHCKDEFIYSILLITPIKQSIFSNHFTATTVFFPDEVSEELVLASVDQLLPLLLVSFASRQQDPPVMPVPRLPAPRVGGGRYRVLCGSNVYRHCTKKTQIVVSVMCLTHFDLKILKLLCFFKDMSCWSTWLCPTLSDFQVYQQTTSQKSRHADLTDSPWQLRIWSTTRLGVAMFKATGVRRPRWRALGSACASQSARSDIMNIYHEMKDGKWTESGLWWLGMCVLFCVLISLAELLSDLRSFMFQAPNPNPSRIWTWAAVMFGDRLWMIRFIVSLSSRQLTYPFSQGMFSRWFSFSQRYVSSLEGILCSCQYIWFRFLRGWMD